MENTLILRPLDMKKGGAALVVSLLMALLADLLFFEPLPDLEQAENLGELVLFLRHVPAWTAALFFGLFLFLLVLFRPEVLRGEVRRITVPGCAALLWAVIQGGGFLPFVLLAVWSATLAFAREDKAWSVTAWFKDGVRFLWSMFSLPVRDLAAFARNREVAADDSRGRRMLRNGVFPLGLGAVFLGLFTLANPVIASWLKDAVWDVLQELILPRRLLLWLLAGSFAWASLRPRPGARALDAPLPLGHEEPRKQGFMTPGSMSRALVLFNGLFLVQTAMDAFYLLGKARLPEAFTFAEYVHRGAYTLVVTALLAGAVALTALRPGSATARSPLVRALTYLWIAQNVFLVGTSLWRLMIYVQAYSLTRFRVAALIWMGLVAVGLVLVAARIAWEKTGSWLLNGCGLALAMALLGCALVNVDGMIADNNVSHCREMGGSGYYLDLDYLELLGAEAIPALHRLNRAQVLDSFTAGRALDLEERLIADLGDSLSHWRRWTVRGWRIHKAYPRAASRWQTLPDGSGWSREQ